MRIALPAILLDIEGTIAPISFVHDVLFPYARRNLPEYLREKWADADFGPVRAQIERDAGAAAMPRSEMEAHLIDLMDRDVKATGLKLLQGRIWKRGYEAGELKSVLFADVPAALRRWNVAQRDVRIYSSGSIEAQKLFLKYTTAGDLSPLIRGYYDTTTGPKSAIESYTAIAANMQLAASDILFISDVPAELAAAHAAGMRVLLAIRPGNRPSETGRFPSVSSFEQLDPQ